MDLHDHTISWMISGGFRGDPDQSRNRGNLLALRSTEVRPSLPDRVRAFLRGTHAAATEVDQACCTA